MSLVASTGVFGWEPLAGLNKDGARVLGLKVKSDLPGQNPSAQVVHDGVQIDLRPVEQLDDGDVDVPVFVRLCRAHALLRACGVDRIMCNHLFRMPANAPPSPWMSTFPTAEAIYKLARKQPGGVCNSNRIAK
jgi:hypothetical protein